MNQIFPPEVISQLLAANVKRRFCVTQPEHFSHRWRTATFEEKSFSSQFIQREWTTSYRRPLPKSDVVIAVYFLYLNRWKDEEMAILIEPHHSASDNEILRRMNTRMSLEEFEKRIPLILHILHTSRTPKVAVWRIERMYEATATQLGPWFDIYQSLADDERANQ